MQNSKDENLYSKLVAQINKDFQLSNLYFSFEENISPIQLKEDFTTILSNLITNKYDDYLNFVYRVDVSESELLKIKEKDLPEIVDQIVFLVLKREFQKVWFKQNFK
ncbi:hypothetical protein [Lutibacter sp. HS1-25]|uniref:hypothetical protein n=1 Tax=Lutibacter sp. HS1-25 TaxID=2485000 RepID=UPI0013E94203|nr:hypothetical protein [Lutibacter sp. HS1-25]